MGRKANNDPKSDPANVLAWINMESGEIKPLKLNDVEAKSRVSDFKPSKECAAFSKYWTSAASYIATKLMRRDQHMALALLMGLFQYVDYDNVLRTTDGKIAKVSDIANDLGIRTKSVYECMHILYENGIIGKVCVNKFRGHSDEFGEAILINPFVFCRTNDPLMFVVEAFSETEFNPEFNPEIIEEYNKHILCFDNGMKYEAKRADGKH